MNIVWSGDSRIPGSRYGCYFHPLQSWNDLHNAQRGPLRSHILASWQRNLGCLKVIKDGFYLRISGKIQKCCRQPQHKKNSTLQIFKPSERLFCGGNAADFSTFSVAGEKSVSNSQHITLVSTVSGLILEECIIKYWVFQVQWHI